jgi:hypothetical protein
MARQTGGHNAHACDLRTSPRSPFALRHAAALAVSRWIERQTGWSIRKFVRTARRYRTVEIQAGDHVITATYYHP